MKIGYSRISDKSQNIDSQITALQKFGVDKIVQETATGWSKERILYQLIENLQPEDVLVVVDLSRFGRSTLETLRLIEEIEEKQSELVILNLGVDTRTPSGKLVLNVMSSLFEFERENNKERQRRGIDENRRKGLPYGRKPGFTREGLEEAIEMYENTDKTVQEISRITRVSKGRFYKELKIRGIPKRTLQQT